MRDAYLGGHLAFGTPHAMHATEPVNFLQRSAYEVGMRGLVRDAASTASVVRARQIDFGACPIAQPERHMMVCFAGAIANLSLLTCRIWHCPGSGWTGVREPAGHLPESSHSPNCPQMKQRR